MKKGCARPFLEKMLRHKIVLLLLRLILSAILSRRCRLSQSDLLKKAEKNRQKLLRFIVFPAKNIGTILSRRSRLSRTSRAPSRLIRPRPIDCDAGPKQTVKTFPFWGSNIVKKRFFQKVRHLVVIYTPKEAHSWIFVTGGSVFA